MSGFNTQLVFQKYSERIIQDIRKSIADKGLTASGKSAKTLKATITESKLLIEGEGYFDYMQNGRGPSQRRGSGPSLYDQIREWIDVKGIVARDRISRDSLAFLITRKIHRDGIMVPHGEYNPGLNEYNHGGVLSDVINDKLIKEIEQEMAFNVITSATSEIKGILNIK
jgi:hypothetical protein